MSSAAHKYTRGFTMVEALVALVVLGVGMLGIAGLYVTTLRASGSAISRMQAVNLASDLADRIRANRTAGEAYEADADDAGADEGCIGGTTNCSPDDMAATDLSFWKQQIEGTLPGEPTGEVIVDGSNPRTYTITISWAEPGENERLSYVLRMEV